MSYSKKTSPNSFILIVSVLWIAAYIFLASYALQWDNRQYLEAQDIYGDVHNNSPEVYYP